MKKLWKNNRVVFVLVIILIICFISIIGVTLTFFYSKDTSTYGNRLDNIEKYPVSNEFKASYKDKMLENENVKSINFDIKGRIIYITINFDENIDLEKAITEKQFAPRKGLNIDSRKLDQNEMNTIKKIMYEKEMVMQSNGVYDYFIYYEKKK